MIGERHSAHTIGHGLVYETRNGGLTVEQRVIGVNVQVYVRYHRKRSGESVRKMNAFVKSVAASLRVRQGLSVIVAKNRL